MATAVRASLGLEKAEVPGFVRLAQPRDGRFDASEELRGRGRQGRTNADGDAPWPVPHTRGGHAFHTVHELERSTNAGWKRLGSDRKSVV